MPQYTEHTGRGRRRSTRDPLIGTWLDDRYLIEERIATGGFAAVYRARTADAVAVALKVLHPRLTTDPAMVVRFQREGATLAQLRDPHTVRTLAVGETRDGLPYIAMELLTGESLLDRLTRRHALAWRQAVEVARAVCHSLAEAHALGVVHRDLKPANIHIEVFGAGERVKVIDFGIAKIAPGSAVDDGMDLTIAGHTIGTSDYMSPEQIVGGRCEATSDIYSLGIVLYEMLTGWRPFARLTSPAATMTALLTQTPQPPSAFAAVPPALDRIVMRCLARDPEHRFAGIAELAAELDRLTGGSLAARDDTTAVHPLLQIESVDVPLDDAPVIYEVHEVAAIRDAEPPQLAPPARGSTRDARPPKFDGFATLQGVAVPTNPPSRPRLAAATRPRQPPAALPLPPPSALAPRPPPSRWRERLIAAAILVCAATLAGLASYLIGSSL